MAERRESYVEGVNKISVIKHGIGEEQGASKSSKLLVEGLKEYLYKHE